jgi:hypothetical protein
MMSEMYDYCLAGGFSATHAPVLHGTGHLHQWSKGKDGTAYV